MRHLNVLSNKKQRFFFFNIGLIISLLLVVLAFKIDFEKESIIIEFEDPFPPIVNIDQMTSHKEKEEVPEKIIPKKNNQYDIEKIDPFSNKAKNKKDKNSGGTTNTDIDTFIQIIMPPEQVPVIHDAVAIMPEFPGGYKSLMKYLGENIIYPDMEVQVGISGKVFVEFVVSEDGSIDQIKTLMSPSKGLTLEAERVVRRMPKWEAGIQNGKRVKVRYRLPISFQLRN